jgi:hypothetical protein
MAKKLEFLLENKFLNNKSNLMFVSLSNHFRITFESLSNHFRMSQLLRLLIIIQSLIRLLIHI